MKKLLPVFPFTKIEYLHIIYMPHGQTISFALDKWKNKSRLAEYFK